MAWATFLDPAEVSFSPDEMTEVFDDLVSWVETGALPCGDNVLAPVAVADPGFGFDYTRNNGAGYRPFVGVPA